MGIESMGVVELAIEHKYQDPQLRLELWIEIIELSLL